MDQALWGDCRLGEAVLVEAIGADEDLRALQERRGDDAEPAAALPSPPLGLNDADALLDLPPGGIAAAEYGSQPADEGGNLCA